MNQSYNANYYNFELHKSKYNSGDDDCHNVSNEIRNNIRNKSDFYKIFLDLTSQKHIKPYLELVQNVRNNFTDLIIIGMGGAILNPQTILSLALVNSVNKGPKFHFLHNTDPYFFDDLIAKLDLKSCAVMIISNSGNTSEILYLTTKVLSKFKDQNINNSSKHFFFITSPNSGKLCQIATEIGGIIIPHESAISGRFAGLSNVSIVPAMIAGIDVEQYLAGASEVVEDFLVNQENSMPALGARYCYEQNKPININLAYLQCFLPLLQWQAQIIAESLGKDGKGYTPVYGLGPNEQHTSLQLYLDGPQDKVFTIFYLQNMAKDVSEINNVQFIATRDALISKNLPVREFLFKDLSARSLGSIVCHLMLEVIFLGRLMKINPFNQPGVELIKQRAADLMNK